MLKHDLDFMFYHRNPVYAEGGAVCVCFFIDPQIRREAIGARCGPI